MEQRTYRMIVSILLLHTTKFILPGIRLSIGDRTYSKLRVKESFASTSNYCLTCMAATIQMEEEPPRKEFAINVHKCWYNMQ